ncbi:MAG: energy transducer TonB [Alphaproteobacteria bacterium]|nr:energy transducer TonB [Alphaproteobacteria bacterium]
MAEPSEGAEVAGKARRRRHIAIVYGISVLLLAGFGAGRFWEAGAVLAGQFSAFRHAVAVNLAAQQAYKDSLRADAAAPRAIPAIPHRIAFYPSLAARRHEQGDVLLGVLVLPNGLVGDVRVLHSSGSAQLDAAALLAVGSWVYLPAVKAHRPVAAWTKANIRFQMAS